MFTKSSYAKKVPIRTEIALIRSQPRRKWGLFYILTKYQI